MMNISRRSLTYELVIGKHINCEERSFVTDVLLVIEATNIDAPDTNP